MGKLRKNREMMSSKEEEEHQNELGIFYMI